MVEINGIKTFEGYEALKEIKARSIHKCNLCNGKINKGETYYKYTEKETGWEKKACPKHVRKTLMEKYNKRRKRYATLRKQGTEIKLETDAAGNNGERWAFIAYCNNQEIYRQHGYTPSKINSITPAEGYAILKAVKWLAQAEKKGEADTNTAIVVGSDNAPLRTKLDTRSESGRYRWLWHELNQALLPYRREGRLFTGIGPPIVADYYASKEAFKENSRAP